MDHLLKIWPTISALAEDLDCPYPTVAGWGRRGVPAKRFAEIIAAARRRGATLTFEQLLAWSLESEAPTTQEDAA